MKKLGLATTLTKELKLQLVQKIEPYLKAGLSIRKACLLSGVPRSSLYKIMDEDEFLRDQIDQFRDYTSILVSTMLSRKLHVIWGKQQAGLDIESEDLEFIKWFALNSVHCRNEFGKSARSAPNFDPELELRRINNLIEKNCNNIEYSDVEP